MHAPKQFEMNKLVGSILFLVAITFVSCEKEKDNQRQQDNNYHFTFTVNGAKKSFTGYIAAHTDTTNGIVELIVLGAPSVTSQDNYLGFYLSNDPGKGNIGTGQYLGTATNYTLLSTYALNAVEYESGQTMEMEAISNNVTIVNHFKVNITSMDKTTIRGTFSGDYFADGDVKNGAKLTITDGDFYVKFL